MHLPHPFPYQGSKRKLAKLIIDRISGSFERVVEPFAGSAAFSIAALFYQKARQAYLNDINEPLMHLWQHILTSPEPLAQKYQSVWLAQLDDSKTYYNEMRQQFNQTHEPHLLLYLLARCVKASVRYNTQGEFNQSPDHRRLGMHPRKMRENLLKVSALLKNRVELSSVSFEAMACRLTPQDLVYMDPPYEGVCIGPDSRYIQSIDRKRFIEFLTVLNFMKIPYIISYDGKLGDKSYGEPLPTFLNLQHIELEAGRSSQETLLGRNRLTVESLYFSSGLSETMSQISPFSGEKQLNLAGFTL